MGNKFGFTLTELIIAVAIVAIASAIAYPSYLYYLRVNRRSDAHVTLLKLASLQDNYFLYHNKYALLSDLIKNSKDEEFLSQNGFYQVKADVTDSSYIITATAIGSQEADNECAFITLSSDGRKSSSSHQACW